MPLEPSISVGGGPESNLNGGAANSTMIDTQQNARAESSFNDNKLSNKARLELLNELLHSDFTLASYNSKIRATLVQLSSEEMVQEFFELDELADDGADGEKLYRLFRKGGPHPVWFGQLV